MTSAVVNTISIPTGRAAARSPHVREASFADYAQISALEAKFGLETKVREEWVDLWIRNPAYLAFRQSLPIGWVLECGNQIVGFLGNVPLFYELEGRRLLAVVARAWVVEPEYRGYSAWLLQYYFDQKGIDIFLNATVGPAAFAALGVFEAIPVPVGDWDQAAFWITNYRGFVSSWLAMKRIPLRSALSCLVAAGLYVKDFSTRRRMLTKAGKIAVRPCQKIDERFDVFWQAVRERNKDLLMGIRNRETLEWHFSYALRDGKAWLLTIGNDTEITAYAIFRRHDNPIFGLLRMHLVDFQSLETNPNFLPAILAWALQECQRTGIHMLESIGFCGETGKALAGTAPYKRHLPCWLYFYKATHTDLARKLSNPNAWSPSQFDGDASL